MGDANGLSVPRPQFSALRTFHETRFVLKVSEFTTGTQRGVYNGLALLHFSSLWQPLAKNGCGNEMHNTLLCASEIVSGHIYWGFRAANQ